MKRILAIALLTLLLGACATPYYPVYVNDSDYYIAEKQSTEGYYGAGGSPLQYSSFHYIGMNPWWEFSYYSPYFYPYYFSVWHPPRYNYWYGTYGWYRYYPPYHHSPYRRHMYPVPVQADQPIATLPPAYAPPSVVPVAPTAPALINPALRSDADSRFRQAIYPDLRTVTGVSTKTPGASRSSPAAPRSVYRPSRNTSIPSYSGSHSVRSVHSAASRSPSRSSSMRTGSSIRIDKD